MTDRLASTATVLRARDIEVDVRAGVVRRNGQRISLPDQPLHLLAALLERPGELVTRDELRQKLWPADTFVDFEHGLNAAVKRLRDALGDSAETPQYIETVPRRGYRFIATLDGAPAVAPPGAGSDVTHHGEKAVKTAASAVVPEERTRRAAILLGAGSLAVLVSVGWWAVRQRTADHAAAIRSPSLTGRGLTRLTFGEGLQTDVTWSPDGQRIAYASDKAGNFDIWVQSVAGGEPTRLTTSPDNDTQPAWAPHGDSIAFRSEREGGGIFVVSALGGAARKLTTFGAYPIWMPDGRDIFVGMGVEGAFARAYLVSASGDESPREILSGFLESGAWEWMAPHPDGRISAIGSHRIDGFGFYTVSRDGRVVTIVKPPASLLLALSGEDAHPQRRFQWSPLGNAVYIEEVAANEIQGLWKIPVAPTTLEWLSAERLTTGTDSAPAISPDGTRLAFASQQTSSRAWLFPFDAAKGRLEGDGHPVTDEDTTIRAAGLSRDGRSILYCARRTGTSRIDALVTNLETGATSLLARSAVGLIESHDGTRHAYVRTVTLARWRAKHHGPGVRRSRIRPGATRPQWLRTPREPLVQPGGHDAI
jgi:DNA-binding winged helix-turn-helix (wHTH) protein/WD40 repeat protein